MIHKIDRVALAATVRDLQDISSEDKAALLELINDHKKYGLVWEEKPENVVERLRDEIPVLREVKERAIISNALDAPNHIIIEGDNLEALTTLSYTHEGKIDVIYIDPPYNTGNKDFVYNDSFVDAEDSYRHSKWLSFMNKRLKIAKRLLSDKGVIFISIDDNEQAQLKLMCDELFGGNNFLAQIIWERAYAPINLKKHYSVCHDYILCYANNIANAICNGLPRSEDANSKYKNPDNDPRGLWRTDNLAVGPRVESQVYEIITPSGRKVMPPEGYCWRLTKERFLEYVADNRIWFGENGDLVPAPKRFLSEVKDSMTPMTIWKYTEVGHSQDAMRALRDIFDGKVLFSYPKSVPLIERTVRLYSQKKSIILDFFAGSGTTLHATMQLNAEDGGHRQCILVTNNENNICEEVTYERNKRVINGYTTPKGDKVEGLHNNSLRYYKTDFLPRDRSMSNMRQLVNASTDLLCIKEDLYSEQKTFGRWKIPSQIARYFSDGQKHMLIVYDERLVEQLPKMINEIDSGKERIKIYIFSPSRYAFDDEFFEVQDKVQLVALPAAIYDAYSKVLPKRKPQLLDTEDEKEAEMEINLDNLFDLPEEE